MIISQRLFQNDLSSWSLFNSIFLWSFILMCGFSLKISWGKSMSLFILFNVSVQGLVHSFWGRNWLSCLHCCNCFISWLFSACVKISNAYHSNTVVRLMAFCWFLFPPASEYHHGSLIAGSGGERMWYQCWLSVMYCN